MKPEISIYFSIITINVNGFNIPVERHRLVEWIKKQDTTFAVCKKIASLAKTHTH
jgi:uncharacterized protein Yka (UPF0111/DUF47 family)